MSLGTRGTNTGAVDIEHGHILSLYTHLNTKAFLFGGSCLRCPITQHTDLEASVLPLKACAGRLQGQKAT